MVEIRNSIKNIRKKYIYPSSNENEIFEVSFVPTYCEKLFDLS